MSSILTGRVSGVTLIEVMVSMALFSAIVLYAAPFYGRFLFSQEAASVQDALESSLSKAQLYSMEGRHGDVWGVIEDNHHLVLFRGGSYTGRDHAYDETSVYFPSVILTGLEEPIFFSRLSGQASREADISLIGNGASVRFQLGLSGFLNQE